MTSMRRVLLLVFVLLAAPATAEAGWRTDRATKIAETVWDRPITINLADPSTRQLSSVVAGWADEGSGIVNLNRHRADLRDWEPFCSTVLHEAGHEAGFRDPRNPDPLHSHSPNSIMYASTSYSRMTSRTAGSSRVEVTWEGTDPRCAKRGRPYLERHGFLTSRSSRP